MSDLVEHGISVSKGQMSKLRKGGAINVKRPNIVSSDDAPIRVRIGRGKSKKMMNALAKDRGFRLAVMPNEDLIGMTEGGKISLKGTVFDRKFKSPSELRDTFGVTAIGKAGKKAVKGYMGGVEDAIDGTNYVSGVTKRGFDRKLVDSGVGKQIASNLIDVGANILLPAALGGLSMVAGDPTGISGNVVGSIAGKYIDEAAARKGYGVYKKLSKVGISKKMVKSAGKALLKEAAKAGGEALTAYTGNPAAGMAFEKVATTAGNKAIDSSSVKKTVQSLGSEGKMLAIELVDDYADEHLSGVEKRTVEKALAGKYPNARELIYDYGNSKLEELNPPEIYMGRGMVRRTRTGLRMGGRMGCGGAPISRKMVGMGMGSMDDMVLPPQAPTPMIQVGNRQTQMFAAANSPFLAGSPLLAKPIVGGSFRPSGGSYTGGSFLPA
jgi:hypothetical protein